MSVRLEWLPKIKTPNCVSKKVENREYKLGIFMTIFIYYKCD